MLNLIFCVDRTGLFGRKNELPWNFKEDLKYFKDITTNFNKIDNTNNVIVMGYNTWISLKKKLPNRINVVISNKYKEMNETNPDYIYKNFDNFIIDCKKDKLFYNKNIFIIGGKKLLSSIIFKYNNFIKHIFMNVIEHSFPHFLDDIVFNLYSFTNFTNFNIVKLSSNCIYCLNNLDNKYYYITFNKMINKNFNINDIIKFTDSTNTNNYNNIYTPIIDHNILNQYAMLEVHDLDLNYCDECDLVTQPVSFTEKCKILCNNCIKNKCKCLFC